jgi:hypothetical protein
MVDSAQVAKAIDQAHSGQAGPVELGWHELQAIAQIAYAPEKVVSGFRYDGHGCLL